MPYTADDDPELRGWLRFQAENGNPFLRSLCASANGADVGEYQLLRPALVRFRSRYPEPNSSVVTLVTDEYRVIYNDVENATEVVCTYNRFNAAIFDNKLPETAIRWAFSIQSLRSQGSPIGLLALPEDLISHPIPDQFRLKAPHIFITERLRGVSPLDEWVLLHEMCHFLAPHHGPEFLQKLQRALDRIGWSVLLGGADRLPLSEWNWTGSLTPLDNSPLTSYN